MLRYQRSADTDPLVVEMKPIDRAHDEKAPISILDGTLKPKHAPAHIDLGPLAHSSMIPSHSTSELPVSKLLSLALKHYILV